MFMSGAAKAMRKNSESGRARQYRKSRARALAAVLLYGLAGSTVGVAQVAPAPSENTYNDQLLKLPPEGRATALSNHLGMWCIGTKPFYMGMTKAGTAKGYAYWSITCAGGQSYMIQITPDGKGAAIDCATLKQNGQGRECYKTF
jgi:hypothetical protein